MSYPVEPAALGRRSFRLGGLAAIVGASALAAGISAAHRMFPDDAERAVAVAGAACVAAGVLALAVYALTRRSWLTPSELALAVFAAAGIVFGGFYLFSISAGIFQHADVLIWSESPFVSDIIKFRTGAPIYDTPADFDSFWYTPGSQLLTYALASLAGVSTSIPAFRVIQLTYTIVAALLIADSTRGLMRLAGVGRREEPASLWGAVIAIVAVLAAGNQITNPFTYMLHNDALGLLVCAVAFGALVGYAETRQPGWLVVLAFVPATGFMVKQSLGIWGPLVIAYLLVFDRPRSWRRIIAYGASAAGILAAAYAGGRALWGPPFLYWTTGLGHHPFSVLRSIQHALEAWAFFAVGFAAAAVCFRSHVNLRLLGLWCIWLALLSTEAYTSGIAWMLNHMGPGSLLAIPWFGVLLTSIWPVGSGASWRMASGWLQPAAMCAAGVLALSGFGAVWVPVPAYPPDLSRYVAAIEGEVQGQELSRVLIDHGSWLYMAKGIVMKDRMAPIGDAGYAGTGDFSGIIGRIEARYYTKISGP